MAKFRFWRCPDCGGTFKHLHHPSDAPPPDRCALCGAWMSDAEPTFVPQAPGIRNGAKVRAVEDVYYAMEDGSKARAEAAAQILPGVSASDLTHMHITNSTPNLINSNNEVAQRMAAMQGVGLPTGFGGGVGGGHNLPQYSHIPQGGLGIQSSIIQQHFQNARQVMSEGNMGSYTPKR